MSLFKAIKSKYNHGYIRKFLKSFRKTDREVTQSEYVNLLNSRLPKDKNIIQAQLSYYVNGVKSPPQEVRELMIEIMGEEAGAVYPWKMNVVTPLREEVKELQDTILHLSPGHFKFSWRREAFKTLRYLIIAGFFLTWMFIFIYWEPFVDKVAEKHYSDHIEEITTRDDEIVELKDIKDSQNKRIRSLNKKIKEMKAGLVEKGEIVKDIEEKRRKAK